MPLRVEVYRAFGINHAGLTRKRETRLSRSDLASLIVSSFLICGHLYQGQNFEGVSNPSLMAEIERSMESNNAYDQNTGNIKPESIESLAQTISTIPSLTIFGDNLVYGSFVGDVYHAVRLSPIVDKSPLQTLEALSGFEYKINRVGNVALDHENIHYMVAIPRRRTYSYAFNPGLSIFLVADDRTTPAIMVSLDQATDWFGGKLHIVGNTISVDAEAGNLQRDSQKVVNYLREQFGKTGPYFEIQKERILNSKGETFDVVWESMRKEGMLREIDVDPREWEKDINPLYKQIYLRFLDEFRLMSNRQLEQIFIELISGNPPVIESSTRFLASSSPLLAFVDNLSDVRTDIQHHFRARFKMRMAEDLLEMEREEGDLTQEREVTLNKIIEGNYKYLAFLSALREKWGRD